VDDVARNVADDAPAGEVSTPFTTDQEKAA
jgi:hypothetical protein